MFCNIVVVFAALFIISANAVGFCGTIAAPANCVQRCQNITTGGTLPSATKCSDTRSDCALLFDCPIAATATYPLCQTNTDTPATSSPAYLATDPTTYPKVRAPGCDSSSLTDIALQCAYTCKICCETPQYNCQDDDTGVVDCEANKGKCNDGNWTDIMATYCPNTCGLCTNGTCKDMNTGCSTLESLCRDIEFYPFMKANCSRTCGFCASANSSCTDLATNCAANNALCTNTQYRTLMQQQCCATCSTVNGNNTSTNCADTNPSCGSWVNNGFCSSSFYTSDQKRQYCGRSCNLC